MTGRDDLLDRLTRRPAAAAAPVEESDAADDRGVFGLLRGARDRAVMIDFRLTSGERAAFPYAALERLAYDPAGGVELTFVGGTVRLTGRNLADAGGLWDGLLRQRVCWVQEMDAVRGAFAPADAAVLTRIDVTAAGG